MAAHGETFVKNQGYQAVPDAGQNAMHLHPMIIDDTAGDGDFLVIGQGGLGQGIPDDLVVQVTCAPQGGDSTPPITHLSPAAASLSAAG